MTLRRWPYQFNPDNDLYWADGGSVDWMRGSWVADYNDHRKISEVSPWIPKDKRQAETMIRRNSEETLRIYAALLSWRSCAISQLRSGLAGIDLPEFTRDEVNLYGALLRLGYISIGFSLTERWASTRTDQTWIGICEQKRSLKRLLRLLGRPLWTARLMTDGAAVGARYLHARHNTFTCQTGLAFAYDDRVNCVTGDGWSKFGDIDEQASAEERRNTQSTTDMLALTHTGALAAIEVQSGVIDLRKKLANWTDFLRASSMGRRGLLCVWLIIPQPGGKGYIDFKQTFDRAAEDPAMNAGEPTVGQRMGWALWSDWFDEQGAPRSENLGIYTDMQGVRRSVFDPAWAEFAPARAPLSYVSEWGWRTMREQILDEWGWDVAAWTMPSKYRGGFYGLTSIPEQLKRETEGA